MIPYELTEDGQSMSFIVYAITPDQYTIIREDNELGAIFIKPMPGIPHDPDYLFAIMRENPLRGDVVTVTRIAEGDYAVEVKRAGPMPEAPQ